MKKLIIIAVGLALVGNLSVFAKEKKEPTAEQKKIKEEIE
jgi:hypothetical protein